MDPVPFDFAEARNRMVDGQIRPNKVTDPRILDAMRRLPRERFLPPGLAARAYTDEDVKLGDGRVLMEPMVIARLVQAAAPLAGERALVVACGPGYGAALLAACGVAVTALESSASLRALAAVALAQTAPGVVLVGGRLADGWAAGAPWDIVLIEGAVQAIPPAIAAQLRRDGGRLVTVHAPARGPGGSGQGAGPGAGPAARQGAGHGVLAEAGPAGLSLQPVFDCATPLLPDLLHVPGFVF